MLDLIENGYQAKRRPSGHDISDKFQRNNGGAIPPNLLAIPNTESNSHYLRYCKEQGIKPHPARFPARLPEYFVRMLTDENDLVFDPFGGSCVTGEVCEALKRRWVCCETMPEYVAGAKGRFTSSTSSSGAEPGYYKIYSPSVLWNGVTEDSLPVDGGCTRPAPKQNRHTDLPAMLNVEDKKMERKPDKIIQPSLFD